MQKNARIALGIVSLALGFMYVLPIWKISLEAPQYPEGLGMYIWIDTVTGVKANDLNNINNLNHYIGMKRIVPETIPELKIMPWIIAFFMVFGLVTALTGNKMLLYVWTGAFIIVAIVGLIDFYLWEYDYGHNLDQEIAIIKIPGMNYQPPLIGSKQLLNFTATSWPWIGGWFAFLALLTGMVLSFKNLRSKSKAAATAAVVALLGLTACAPEPVPIDYGKDVCAHCMMQVSDDRYGAEAVTVTGKTFPFDSIECLAAWAESDAIDKKDIHSYWVTDFSNPAELTPLEDVFFLLSPNLPSPMGANLTAFGSGMTREAALNSFAGEILDWEGVISVVTSDPVPGEPVSNPSVNE